MSNDKNWRPSQQWTCSGCNVKVEKGCTDETKCTSRFEGRAGGITGMTCHNCFAWGGEGSGDAAMYEKSACKGCRSRLVSGAFQAAEKCKAKADEMKVKLAASESPRSQAEAECA
mmetsp:Transcript_11676/g.27953  ORF Transcript_11676/g.27953 Transcript_11676/m.27953 type:complete len:115 (+) Transcript_11676:216-560(+)|eukprot:CAMPEP_0177722066 /NCGR_PEP_ID=MMETSP0484_2-20121128/17491_1 /TAXON_ID=354590 /ORGANISM="Rhodomonas lens, Strain RHODO" /LENGTH=114 /DNA_ID=CAMNT_0019234431 /DNA_START=203 /DNA_END=547 /DNA_ORIENTATION=+